MKGYIAIEKHQEIVNVAVSAALQEARRLFDKTGPLVEKSISPKEAADFLGVAEHTILNRISEGKLPAYRFMGTHLFKSELYELIKNNPAITRRAKNRLKSEQLLTKK